MGFSREVKVGMGFAGGVLLGFVLLMMPLGWLLVLLPLPSNMGLFNVISSALAFFCGGCLAGASLGRGRRTKLAFGLAFAVTLPFLVLTIIGIQGLGGRQHALRLLVWFGGPAVPAFGILGALGVAVAGEPWRTVAAGAIIFATSGAVGGVLFTMALLPYPPNRVLAMLGALAFLLVPPALGGAALARRIPSPGSQA